MKRYCISLLAVLTLSASAQTKEFTILATNDMHAAVENFSRFAAIVDSVRELHPDLLLLSGGDNRTGNPINDMYPITGYPMVALMNRIGFDLSAVGNHEFDSKLDGFRELINLSNFRYVCANMYPNDTLRLHIEPYKFFERDGIRFCILGFIQVNRNGIPDAHPDAMRGITFRYPNDVAPEYKWLRDRCDVLILLTHNGYEADIELAKVFPEADLIVGGHSHTPLEGNHLHSGVLITQAGKKLTNVTEIKLKLQDGKVIDKQAHLIRIADCPRIDTAIQAMVDKFSDNPVLNRVLTQVPNGFSSKQELGCMMADAQRATTGADIAIQNCGGVRYETLPKGGMTVGDVLRLDPFGNEMMIFNLTGAEVKELLKAICRADDYGPAYVSGITYQIDLGRTNREVKAIKVRNEKGGKFDENRTYKVAVNSYVASVADYKRGDKDGTRLHVKSADEIMKYLEQHPSIDYKGAVRRTYTGGEDMEK